LIFFIHAADIIPLNLPRKSMGDYFYQLKNQ